jgi:hypothetical protein
VFGIKIAKVSSQNWGRGGAMQNTLKYRSINCEERELHMSDQKIWHVE